MTDATTTTDDLAVDFARQAHIVGVQHGIPLRDVAYAMLAISAGFIRDFEGRERFIEIMELCASVADDAMSAGPGAAH